PTDGFIRRRRGRFCRMRPGWIRTGRSISVIRNGPHPALSRSTGRGGKSCNMKSTKLLVVIAVMQGLILAGQWLGQASLVAPAQAQVPDAGAQRERLIDEVKNVSSKLDRLVTLLESGNVTVKTVSMDGEKKSK